MILKVIYIFFIGILLATFVGVGIAAFYTGPKFPDQPALLKYCAPEIAQSASKYAEFKKDAQAYDFKVQQYQLESQVYNRNVSIVSLIAAIIIVILSLTFFKKILVIADGLLLGGVVTLLYSIIRGFQSEDNMFRFFVVTVGLVVSIWLGYIKFISKQKAKK
ncbi:MAG TPA: hypothetical protein VND99_01640 [Candidatus Acidoferrales bacterium]|nr:hypothetical protein [Candidatus Acidoferrales bacterium]